MKTKLLFCVTLTGALLGITGCGPSSSCQNFPAQVQFNLVKGAASTVPATTGESKELLFQSSLGYTPDLTTIPATTQTVQFAITNATHTAYTGTVYTDTTIYCYYQTSTAASGANAVNSSLAWKYCDNVNTYNAGKATAAKTAGVTSGVVTTTPGTSTVTMTAATVPTAFSVVLPSDIETEPKEFCFNHND